MKKIRRFKLTEHTRETSRRIKKSGINLENLGLQEEPSLKEFVNTLLSETDASVVYASFDDEFSNAKNFFDIFSAGVITLGKNIENKINSYTQQELKDAAQICALEFLDSAFDFVTGLIKEEAGKENFEILPAKLLHMPEFANRYAKEQDTEVPRFIRKNEIATVQEKESLLPLLMEKLDISKISVSNENNIISPSHTVAFAIQWQRKKRRKK
ncbi:MAG TPA: hypothetical protein VMW66_03925 [Elusimicrobiales bacterium]|nr:hypothetical protein [Elusimicrobiales bacterium]